MPPSAMFYLNMPYFEGIKSHHRTHYIAPTMKVTAILKGMIDQNGQQPVQIRVADGTQRRFIPTHVKVKSSQFENGRIKNHPKAKEYNKIIETAIYQSQATQLEAPKIPKVKLIDYIDTCIGQWEKLRAKGTVDGYKSKRTVIADYSPNALLTDITVKYLYDIQAHRLQSTEGNTTLNTLKFLRIIVLKAISEGLIKNNPFERGKFKMPPYKPPRKTYLTEEEINRIERITLSPDCQPTIKHLGTWFLIACNIGLRISDLRKVNREEHIIQGRLILYPEKGKDQTVVSIPFSGRLKELFERIDYKPLGMSGQKYNVYLKAIAASVGIKKDIASHVARHTAAMRMADAGISQEVAGKVLGHSDLRSTSVYYKISGKRIDSELEKLM